VPTPAPAADERQALRPPYGGPAERPQAAGQQPVSGSGEAATIEQTDLPNSSESGAEATGPIPAVQAVVPDSTVRPEPMTDDKPVDQVPEPVEDEAGTDQPHGLGWLLSMSGLGAVTPEPEPAAPDPSDLVIDAPEGTSDAPVSDAAPTSDAAASAMPVSAVPISGPPVSGPPISGAPVSALPVSGAPQAQDWFSPTTETRMVRPRPADQSPVEDQAPVEAQPIEDQAPVEAQPVKDPQPAGDHQPVEDQQQVADQQQVEEEPAAAAVPNLADPAKADSVMGEAASAQADDLAGTVAPPIETSDATPVDFVPSAEPERTVGEFEAQLTAPEPVEAEPVQAQPAQAQPVEAQPVEAQPVEAQPVEAQPVEAELVEVQPVEAEVIDAEVVAGHSADAEPVEEAPTPTDPIEAELVEAELVEPETTTTEPTDPTPAAPIDADIIDAEVVEEVEAEVEAEVVEADPQTPADPDPHQPEPTPATPTQSQVPSDPRPDTAAPRTGNGALRTPSQALPVLNVPPPPQPDLEPERRRADPEQILVAYPWQFDPVSLRETVDDPEPLLAVRDRLTDRLEYAERDTVRAGLLSLRAVVSRVLGDLGRALADAREALRHAEAAGELRQIAVVQARLAHVQQWRGDFAEADRLFEEANSVELPDRLRAEMHVHAGKSCYEQGRYLEACNHFEAALELRRVSDPELVARTEFALDAVMARVKEAGWGPYPRSREEILQQSRPPHPALDYDSGWQGYADSDGEVVIPERYAEAQPFHEGVAWVRRPGTAAWELIDETGALVIDSASGYVQAGRFADGLAWVSREPDGGWFAVDWHNRVIVPGGFEEVRAFRHGLAVVRRGGWGAIDRHGRVVVQLKYQRFATELTAGGPVEGFTSEGLAVIDAGDRFGVVDRSGQLRVAPVHARLLIHPVAFVVADRDDRWGALDRNGDPIIEVTRAGPGDVVDEIARLHAGTRPVL
jgi:tetratricopeptide (TPR) repeat protein